MRRFLTLVAACSISRVAFATNITEFPDNGSEQMARGGAWVARASDPLAGFYNPAGLAGQETRLTLNANIILQQTCFTRVASANDTTSDSLMNPADRTFPQVCNAMTPFPNPQLAFTAKLTDRVGLGISVVGPSAAGRPSWPEFVTDAQGRKVAAPQRYLLLEADAFFLTPTIAVGAEVTDNLRIGASFQWGLASLQFSNSSYAINQNSADPRSNDIKAHLKVNDFFVPGTTLGVLWSPSPLVDVAAWFKGSASIEASGDVKTFTPYFNQAVANGNTAQVHAGDTAQSNCVSTEPGYAADTGLPGACGPGQAQLVAPIPIEAKLGVRVHQPRPNARDPHRRDPMSQDVWDAEIDLTFANNENFRDLQIRFPGNPDLTGKIPVLGTPGGTLPPNADVVHAYKNVFGVRAGGDWNVVPDRVALRAGMFFETDGQQAQYQNIDFMGGARIGLTFGAGFRIPLAKPQTDPSKRSALEFSVGFMHMFVLDQSYKDPNSTEGVRGLAGSTCNPDSGFTPGNPTCANGTQIFRTNWPVNLGTITSGVTVINIGAAYRF